MSVCCSVGYYGPCANSIEETHKEYDLACPNVCDNGRLNFWKSRCLERIGNKDIKSCHRGCKEAAKHPVLKAKMDKVIKDWEDGKEQRELDTRKLRSKISRNRYMYGLKKEKSKSRITAKDRAKIVDMYTNGKSVTETVEVLGCGRTAVSFYRKMFRDGVLKLNGTIKHKKARDI